MPTVSRELDDKHPCLVIQEGFIFVKNEMEWELKNGQFWFCTQLNSTVHYEFGISNKYRLLCYKLGFDKPYKVKLTSDILLFKSEEDANKATYSVELQDAVKDLFDKNDKKIKPARIGGNGTH